MAARVSSSTINSLRKNTYAQNVALMRSGKASAEQIEALRRFYPKLARENAGKSMKRGSAVERRLEKIRASKPQGNTRNDSAANDPARALVGGGNRKRATGTNAAEILRRMQASRGGSNSNSPWSRFQKSGGISNVTDTKGKGSPWKQFSEGKDFTPKRVKSATSRGPDPRRWR